jgi:hypothetical protein
MSRAARCAQSLTGHPLIADARVRQQWSDFLTHMSKRGKHHLGAEWQPLPPFKSVTNKSRYFRRKTRGWTLEDRAAAAVQAAWTCLTARRVVACMRYLRVVKCGMCGGSIGAEAVWLVERSVERVGARDTVEAVAIVEEAAAAAAAAANPSPSAPCLRILGHTPHLQALLLSYRGEVRAALGLGAPAVAVTIGGGIVVDDAAMQISSDFSDGSSSAAVCAVLSHFSCCATAFARRNTSLWGAVQAAMARLQAHAEALVSGSAATLLQRCWLAHVMKKVTRQQAFRHRNSLQDTREIVLHPKLHFVVIKRPRWLQNKRKDKAMMLQRMWRRHVARECVRIYGEQLRGDRRRLAAAAARHAAAACLACAWISRRCRRAAAEQKIVWFTKLRVPNAANRIIRAFRGHCARNALMALIRMKRLRAVGLLQMAWRAHVAREKKAYLWKERKGIIADESARIVQKVARGHLGRCMAGKLRRIREQHRRLCAAQILQSQLRRLLCTFVPDDDNYEPAAGDPRMLHVLRRRERRRVGAEVAQRSYRMHIARCAATFLQRSGARSKVLMLILVLQRTWRCHVARWRAQAQRSWCVLTGSRKSNAVGVLEIGAGGKGQRERAGSRWMVYNPILAPLLSGARKQRAHFPSIMRERVQLAVASVAEASAFGKIIDPAEIAQEAMRRSHQHHRQQQQQQQQQRVDPDKLLDLLATGSRIVLPSRTSLPLPIETPVPAPAPPPVRKSFGVLGLERRGGLTLAKDKEYLGEKSLKSGTGGFKGVGAAAAMEEADVAVRLGLMLPKPQHVQQPQQLRAVVPLPFVSRQAAMKSAAAVWQLITPHAAQRFKWLWARFVSRTVTLSCMRRRQFAVRGSACATLQRAWRCHASRSRAQARALAVVQIATRWNSLSPPSKKQSTYISRYKTIPPPPPPLPPLRPVLPLMIHAMRLTRTAAAARAAAALIVCCVRCLRCRRLHRVLAAAAAEAARGPKAAAIQRVVRGRMGRLKVQLICVRALDNVRFCAQHRNKL